MSEAVVDDIVAVLPPLLQSLEALAGLADAKAARMELRGVNVEIYKVLKLVKLAPRFSFAD